MKFLIYFLILKVAGGFLLPKEKSKTSGRDFHLLVAYFSNLKNIKIGVYCERGKKRGQNMLCDSDQIGIHAAVIFESHEEDSGCFCPVYGLTVMLCMTLGLS